MEEEYLEYVDGIGYKEAEGNIGLIERLAWDIPESFGDDMNAGECAYPQIYLRRAAAMCRKAFLKFYLETDYNMAFYKMIEYFLITDAIKDGNMETGNSNTKSEAVCGLPWKNEIQLSSCMYAIKGLVHSRLDAWFSENGGMFPEREKAERKQLDIGIILWMADIYVLLSWAYNIPFYCLLCFPPQSLYESYENGKFVTVCDAAKMIYFNHYKNLKGKWEELAVESFHPGF